MLSHPSVARPSTSTRRTRSKASLGECRPYAHSSDVVGRMAQPACTASVTPNTPDTPDLASPWAALVEAAGSRDWDLTLRGVEPSPPPTPPILPARGRHLLGLLGADWVDPPFTMQHTSPTPLVWHQTSFGS